MLWAGGAAFLAMAAIVGQEQGITWSPSLLTAMVTAGSAGAVFAALGKLQAQFQFTDWDNRYL